ncbi:MAG: Mrp/NBP35 family ATP-binding protein [Bdellovibrionales bacterium]|nr:Mrp/NBP35 family ATP-binding protein [Bdellovibrionales bacterium]
MPNQNPFDQQQPIPGVKKIIAVSSGKGGVGKSTVATNLAVALAQLENRVGLLDADIYGPSLPRMMGALNQAPEVSKDNKILPIERHGIKIMSMGLLTPEDTAVVWRGPMLFKAMNQLFFEVDWGELDYLVIDLPPGTGDVQLSMVQKVPVNGAITVCTPQNIALADVKKSIDMFERVNVPILGVVENMSYIWNPENPDEKLQMFPKGDLRNYLAEKNIELIAEVPMVAAIALACEMGIPYTAQKNENDAVAGAYKRMAEGLSAQI